MRKIIQVNDLVKNYRKNEEDERGAIEVLKGFSLQVLEGEYVGIMGKSGCGKTTLLKILGLLERQTSGEVYFKEQDTKDLWDDELADIRRREIGFVFQDFYLMDSISVRENIMLPVVLDKQDVQLCLTSAQRLAEQFGLAHLLGKNPYELSGGEKQRTAICRALISNPDVIFADEPTGNLDSKSGNIVVQEFCKINEKLGKTIVMVTHDPQVASNCGRVIFLKDGKILDSLKRTGGRETFYQEILEKMGEL